MRGATRSPQPALKSPALSEAAASAATQPDLSGESNILSRGTADPPSSAFKDVAIGLVRTSIASAGGFRESRAIEHTDLASELPQEHFAYRPNVDKVVEYLDVNVGPPIHDDGLVKTYDLLAPRSR